MRGAEAGLDQPVGLHILSLSWQTNVLPRLLAANSGL